MTDLCIAVIETVGGHSGMDYYDYGWCSGLHEAGVDVTLYTCDTPGVLKTAAFPVKYYYQQIYGTDPFWQRSWRYLKGSLRSLFRARRSGVQVVHLHFFHVGPLELFNVVASRLLGFKLVVTTHDVDSLVERIGVSFLEHVTYRLIGRVIVHNQVSAREVVASLPVKHHDIAVIPHGNYLNTIDQLPEVGAAREKLGLPREADVLLFFGQIKSTKGLEVLLRAMPTIAASRPNARLIVAGRALQHDFRKYQRIIDECDLADYCCLHIGHIPHRDVATYFAAADLVILPYLKIYQSGVLLMSMSYGKPVLASDLPGMTEIISEGETGYLFRAGNAQALAAKAIHVLSNEAEARRVGCNSLAFVREAHGWETIGRQAADLYKSMVNSSDGKSPEYGKFE